MKYLILLLPLLLPSILPSSASAVCNGFAIGGCDATQVTCYNSGGVAVDCCDSISECTPIGPPPPPPPSSTAIYCTPGVPGSGINTAIGCLPLGDVALVTILLNWAIGIAGGIALILNIIAAFLIATSTGDPKRVQAGRELLTSALMGLVLIVLSVVVLNFIGVNVLGLSGLGFNP